MKTKAALTFLCSLAATSLHGGLAVTPLGHIEGAPGAKVFVQFSEVSGEPRIHDNGTPPGEPEYTIVESPCRSLAQIRDIQEEMPPGSFTVPPNDWRHLERTRRILTDGESLHIFALGDSISNDTMRSGWVALLREDYPKAGIRTSGRHPNVSYRDRVHANEYGERILAKILMAWWQPQTSSLPAAAPVRTVPELLAAVAAAGEKSIVALAAGRFDLREPLVLKSGLALKGAGIGQTILTHAPEWQANPATLPDSETNRKAFDRSGYLVHLADKAEGVSLSGMTLTGPRLHGAIFGSGNAGIHLHDLHIEDFMYCGIRTYSLSRANIHDCTFLNAGQRWRKGERGFDGGTTGGGIFGVWTTDTEIWNNRFLNTRTGRHEKFYGIKGRQGKRLKIHHNTIEVNFSIEFAHENDEDIEIAHNVLHGAVSIPKHGGGRVPESGRSFRIRHNLFRDSYAIEFSRNGAEISHNLFEFDPAKDHGNLISGFGKAGSPGPASFHRNLVRNPGRGVVWINEPFANLDIHHNHIRCATTATPRTEGLFAFHNDSNFATIRLTNNVIECEGAPRPLLRNDESAAATIENNRLTGITDTARYENRATGAPAGPGPLTFRCGVNGETLVEDWTVTPRHPRTARETEDGVLGLRQSIPSSSPSSSPPVSPPPSVRASRFSRTSAATPTTANP